MPPKTPRQSGISPSTATTPNLPTYSHGDIVLAKVKGHPAWPARIVDPYASPLNLRDERKIAQKNTYLVKFFKTADYAWMNAKEMSMLGVPEIRAFIDNPNKKGADLKAAYQIALAPEAWEAELEAFQQQIAEEQNALEIDELETVDTDGVAKEAPPKQKQKRKRSSEAKATLASAKKRKSEVRSNDGSAKTSATPEPHTAPVKKLGRKKREEPLVPIDGESVVKEWRHKLQRLFLGKTPLTEKMMPEIAEVFNDIEQFEMKAEWLYSSKLAKVLKRVGVLEDSKIPLDAQYHIRARSRALQDKWRLAFGFPEDISNRPKVVETGAENQSEDMTNKAPVNSTDAQHPEIAVTNGELVADSIVPNDAKEDVDNTKPHETLDEDCTKAEEDQPEPQIVDAPVQQSPPTEAMTVDVNGEHEATNSADVNGHHEGANSADVNGDDREANSVDINVDDQVNKSAEVKGDDQENKSADTNGDDQENKSADLKGDEQEKAIEDIEMAAPNNEASVDEEKPRAEPAEDEMDCADSPEPTTLASNEAENKEKMVTCNN